MPPFEVGLGPPMMGGHPNGGPSPPLHTGLPPLGSHLSGIEGLMDLQTVGQFHEKIILVEKLQHFHTVEYYIVFF